MAEEQQISREKVPGFFYDGEQPYFLTRPLPPKFLFINETDWKRIERLVQRLRPPSTFSQNAFWGCIGLLANAIFGLAGLLFAQDIPYLIIILACCIFSASLVSSLIFGYYYRKERIDYQSSVDHILEEMREIQRNLG